MNAYEALMTSIMVSLLRQDWAGPKKSGPTSGYKHPTPFIGDNITGDESKQKPGYNPSNKSLTELAITRPRHLLKFMLHIVIFFFLYISQFF
jgi:hypothetical protein